jgi:hypothetical protein
VRIQHGIAVATLVIGFGLAGCTPSRSTAYITPAALPNYWRTYAERTDHLETGRYAEAVEFCRRLASASPYARYATFGISGEGRALPLLIISTERAFTPQAAQRSRRPLILVQNCIHAGECEGKDACLELARDMLVCGQHAELLRHVNVLIIPIFNVDGHERRGPYNRINQNGPREMGWRTNAVNLNLNRDYAKADAVEMQAWLHLWTTWQPELFIDNHTTDGQDDQYDLYYTVTADQDVAPPIATWVNEVLMASVLPRLTSDGYLALPYAFLRDPTQPSQGLQAIGPMSPRLSTGYVAACNRPGILVETHAVLPYGRRVRATYDFLRHTLETINEQPELLRDAVRQADRDAVASRGGDYENQVPLRFEPTHEPRPFVYYGVQVHSRPSDITGGEVVEYSKTPVTFDTTLFAGWRVAQAVTPPAAYLIPPQWTEVIRRLELHGVRFYRLRETRELEIESYRFEDVKFAETPHEGRQTVRYRTTLVREPRSFAAGTVVVPLDQPRAKLAVHLLEPDGPDALVGWGFFNAIFERNEYFEPYVMEPIAQRMLQDDPALSTEFEQKLADDAAFAKDPQARLNFFYRRSPYWDAAYYVYPVARLPDAAVLARVGGAQRKGAGGSDGPQGVWCAGRNVGGAD